MGRANSERGRMRSRGERRIHALTSRCAILGRCTFSSTSHQPSNKTSLHVYYIYICIVVFWLPAAAAYAFHLNARMPPFLFDICSVLLLGCCCCCCSVARTRRGEQNAGKMNIHALCTIHSTCVCGVYTNRYRGYTLYVFVVEHSMFLGPFVAMRGAPEVRMQGISYEV